MEWDDLHYRSQSDSTTSERKYSAYFQVVKPLIYSLRLIGGFPCIFHNGVLKVRFCSFWTFYSVVMMTVQILLTVISSQQAYKHGNNQFDNKVYAIINIIIITFQSLCPIALWCNVLSVATYFSKWRSFQEEIRSCGIVMDNKLKRWTISCALFAVPYGILVSFTQSLFHGGPAHMPGYILVHSNSYFSTWIWVFSVFVHLSSSSLLIKRMKEVTLRRNTAELAACRNAWLSLSDLTTDLGNAWGPTLLGTIMLINAVIIISIYGLMLCLRGYLADGGLEQLRTMLGRMFFALLTTSALYSLCELGHRCTDAVGYQFVQELLRVKTSPNEVELQREVNLFTQTVWLRYPDMMLCGFITLNRKLFVSFLSTGITYLIVLVQFRSSESNSIDSCTNTTVIG